jgi:predicted patatin/cPLA2 family phospholipase
MLPGHNSRAVLDLIARRSRGGDLADNRRLGLVVEGGGMRGVYTAGALLALHLMGLRDSFDDLFGTSAGAVNGAHFLAGIAHRRVSTYYTFLAGLRFINPWRITKVVDVDYFADEVLTHLARVEAGLVREARTELWIAVLNGQTGAVELRNPRREDTPLLRLLKAAVAIPVLYGRTVRLGTNDFMDAGFAQPFALSTAIGLGCTDLLVITSRPASDRSKPRSRWQARLFDRCCAKGNARLNSLFRSGWEEANKERCLADGTIAPRSDVNIATIAPPAIKVRRVTTEPKLLRTELLSMCRYVLSIFQHPHDLLDSLVQSNVV